MKYLDRNVLMNLYAVIKSMKVDFVHIVLNTGFIVGESEGFVIYKTSQVFPITDEYVAITTRTEDLKTLLDNEQTIDPIDMTSLPIYPKYDHIFVTIYKSISVSTRYIEYIEDDFKSDPVYQAVNAGKAADGSKLVIKEDKGFFIYKGLIPANKADKVSLYLTPLKGDTFITIFHVKKVKPACEIKVYVQYVNVLQ